MPFLFLFFFHQSSLYPIKIFAKCFYLLVMVVLELHHGLVKIMLCYVGHWPLLRICHRKQVVLIVALRYIKRLPRTTNYNVHKVHASTTGSQVAIP